MTSASADAGEIETLTGEAMVFADRASSNRTKQEYAKDWALFTDFCARHDLEALPAASETVALWATDMARTLKPSTIKRRLAAVSAAHRSHGIEPSPTRSPLVADVVKGISLTTSVDAEARDSAGNQDKAMTFDRLIRTVSLISGDSHRARRDRAVLLIGFSGYFRRSELAGITVEDIDRTAAGGMIRIHLPPPKAGPDGKGTWRDIHAGRPTVGPVAVLDTWLDAAGIETGPVFRPIDRGGNIAERAISARSIDQIVRTRAAKAGFEGMSSHSLRSGAAITAADHNYDLLTIARAGGWSDNSATVARYIDTGTTETPNLGL